MTLLKPVEDASGFKEGVDGFGIFAIQQEFGGGLSVLRKDASQPVCS